MHRRSFPTGQTSTAMLKALLFAVEEAKGKGIADAWLRNLHLEREDLDDETKPVPLSGVHDALAAYAALASPASIPDVWRHLVAPGNLGVWVRVLRGTSSPAEALSRLDATDSEYGRTTRWETRIARAGYWRGRVNIAHDPSLEEDGLMCLGRMAELHAVAALFGYDDASVKVVGQNSPRGAALTQDFEVTWRPPNLATSAAFGGAVGALLGGVPMPYLAEVSLELGAGVWGASCLLGAFLGGVIARDRLRRAQTNAHAIRVNVLERSLVLRETHEREAAGTMEGAVVVGQYRIKKRMGAGASGVIYEAQRIHDGMPVAIKLLRAAAAHEAVASDRLRREAEALGLSWHPNVVEVIDHGHLPDGTAFLVMELLRGESLGARLRSRGRLPADELLPLAIQICDALAAVHAAGVIHRDLKPSNVFLALDADGIERVKILDFGIARVEWEETRITNTGGPVGTPGYMSPEQEAGAEVDARTDLFSLGAVLYEGLIGEPPPPPTPSGLVRTGESPALAMSFRINYGAQKTFVPPAWRAVIEKAMAPLPEHRFQDARTFAQALRALADLPPARPAGISSS